MPEPDGSASSRVTIEINAGVFMPNSVTRTSMGDVDELFHKKGFSFLKKRSAVEGVMIIETPACHGPLWSMEHGPTRVMHVNYSGAKIL